MTGLLKSREMFPCILTSMNSNKLQSVMKNVFSRVETAELHLLAMLAYISKGC